MKIIKSIVEDPYSIKSHLFNNINIKEWNNFLKEDHNVIIKLGQKMAVNLFHTAATRVPAYKDFLKKNKINPELIKSYSDFKHLPIINKQNYLSEYPLEQLSLDGHLIQNQTISVSSGSTGIPFFWPRGHFQEFDTSLSHELFLKYIFEIDKYSTLLIVAYSMGMYVAGPFTFSAAQRVALKGYPLTVVTPSINKVDVVRVLKNLHTKFEQVIIVGYPPFVKDILDLGEEEGINFRKIRSRFIFGAENFTEEWRHFIYSKVKKGNYYKMSMNTYGSADAAILGHESPLSILARLNTIKVGPLRSPFAQDERLPSLNQYNPILRHFEAVDKELVFTAAAGIPLIRYDVGDNGGIVSYNEMNEWLANNGINVEKIFQQNDISECLWKLPFVYLYGRRDFTITLYGLNVYPENIKDALLMDNLARICTGKFVMSQEYDSDHNQYLQIRIELKEGVKATKVLEKETKNIIVKTLVKVNREYSKLYESIGRKADPVIILELYGESNIFVEGVKQRWVKKLN